MAGNFRKCKWCGGIFNFMGNQYCPNCLKQMDEDFTKVRKFVYENPNARVDDIAEETEVEPKMIMFFLREGRLELRQLDGSLTCEKCGAPIATGKLCHKCAQEMSGVLESTLPKQEKPQRPQVDITKKSKLHVNVTKGKEG